MPLSEWIWRSSVPGIQGHYLSSCYNHNCVEYFPHNAQLKGSRVYPVSQFPKARFSEWGWQRMCCWREHRARTLHISRDQEPVHRAWYHSVDFFLLTFFFFKLVWARNQSMRWSIPPSCTAFPVLILSRNSYRYTESHLSGANIIS